MTARLVRVRHEDMPPGLEAFAWLTEVGNTVIVCVNKALSPPERAEAVRRELAATREEPGPVRP
jgi:hypothetical protein